MKSKERKETTGEYKSENEHINRERGCHGTKTRLYGRLGTCLLPDPDRIVVRDN